MYSVKVEVSEPASSSSARDNNDVDENIDFNLGNPRVEHIRGVVHLYRSSSKPEEKSSCLCVLAVPADVGVQEFCLYCGAYLKFIKDLRFLRRENGRSRVYMVCLQFHDQATAEGFMAEYNGQPFSPLEAELVWRLVYVRELEFKGGNSSVSAAETELPTCPVCLERLDEEVSGIITTVCNHRFHNECLVKWGDTSCPVCRYCMQKQATSRCAICNTEEDLWICLICGHVGCGRYKSRHAFDHWQETQHCYALELGTQRVWDYAGDGYVHRLVQSKSDGKLVEVPSPLGQCSGSNSHTRVGDEDKDEEEKNKAIVASKLDSIAFEYNHLLTAQLESQRLYFEGLLCQSRLESEAQIGALHDAETKQAEELENCIKESSKARKISARKLTDANAKIVKLAEELDFVKSMNESLLSNQAEWQQKLKAMEEQLEQARADKEATEKDTSEQIRDLMVYIEAQRLIEDQGGGIEGGSVVGMSDPAPPPPVRGRRSARGHKKKHSGN